jgi:hypothetical protein
LRLILLVAVAHEGVDPLFFAAVQTFDVFAALKFSGRGAEDSHTVPPSDRQFGLLSRKEGEVIMGASG